MRLKSSPDYFFISLIIILVIFGLVMLTSASSDLGKEKFDDSYYYLKHQVTFGLLLGVVGFFFGALIYYRFWERWASWFLLGTIGLLLLVYTPLGLEIGGSERWLNFGAFTIQPGEIIKLTFLVYLSAWLAKKKLRSRSFSQGFIPFLIISGTIALLLFFQPSTTTAVVILGASLLMYFSAGAKIRFLVSAVLLGGIMLMLLIYTTPYRYERLLNYFNPEADPLGGGYHINQSLIAIGSGGLTGVGYGKSTTKINYLPEPIGDSIFAVIAEELGFIGSSILIFLFLLLTWRVLMIAKSSPDAFSRYLATSFASLIGLQVFINVGAISGLIPLTGIPLPFISYGGTSLAVFLTIAGIIVNISKWQTKRIR